MNNQLLYSQLPAFFYDPRFQVLLGILMIWTLVWKGIALWKAAQAKSTVWFIILLLVNTLGILEIIYIFYFSKPKTNT